KNDTDLKFVREYMQAWAKKGRPFYRLPSNIKYNKDAVYLALKVGIFSPNCILNDLKNYAFDGLVVEDINFACKILKISPDCVFCEGFNELSNNAEFLSRLYCIDERTFENYIESTNCEQKTLENVYARLFTDSFEPPVKYKGTRFATKYLKGTGYYYNVLDEIIRDPDLFWHAELTKEEFLSIVYAMLDNSPTDNEFMYWLNCIPQSIYNLYAKDITGLILSYGSKNTQTAKQVENQKENQETIQENSQEASQENLSK
ncbi:MAG: hypothetical protein IJZ62_00100, partial [Clostridia bacterium]|nr:hypothetical protein [Clostridia bacterium]